MRRCALAWLADATLFCLAPIAASSFRTQSVARTAYEQSYLPAAHNWEFRRQFRSADRLFNAFDYGHAILYETLLAKSSTSEAAARLERHELRFILDHVLREPPDVPLSEHAIGTRYGTLVPELVATFDWTHMLHRQIYDVWADRRLDEARKDAAIAALLRYYSSRHDLALSDRPKSMALMEGRRYSLAFRQASPRFNGLIWSYHWLQMALYDALMAGDSQANAQSRVDSTIGRFWSMIDGEPSRMPSVMPMSAAVAPMFSTRYPAAAIIFDNLHALHDVAADILASPTVSRADKRVAILEALAEYRDDTTEVTSRDEWLEMSHAMGVERMGGVAVPPAGSRRP